MHFCHRQKLRFRCVQPQRATLVRVAFRFFESPLHECHTKKNTTLAGGVLFGGLEEIRTPDPHNANVVRSQLRYKPICCGIYRSKIILPQQFSVKAKIIS